MNSHIEPNVTIIDDYHGNYMCPVYLGKIFYCTYCMKIKIEDKYYFFNSRFCCESCLIKNKS